jgi:hypothetical protein
MTAFTVPTVDLSTAGPAQFVAALQASSCVFVTGTGYPPGW